MTEKSGFTKKKILYYSQMLWTGWLYNYKYSKGKKRKKREQTGEKEEGGKKQKEREWKKMKTRNPNNEHAYKINSTFLLTFITPCIPRKSFLIFVIILKISRNFQFWNVCQYVWLIWLVSCRVTCVLGTSCHHKITFHTTVDFVVLGQTTKLCWEADAEGLVNCTY